MDSFERSPQRVARVGGLLYLAIIALGLFGEAFVRGTLLVSGDPSATAGRIAASGLTWRAGIAGDLLMHVLDVPVIVILYLLLRPAGVPLALTATVANLVQTAVLAINKLNLLVPLFLQENVDYLRTFTAGQLDTLGYLAIKAHGFGFAIGLVFFGVACLARGVLIYRCGYLPRVLGLLIAVAGASYLLNSAALVLAPGFAAAIFPAILVPAFLGELSLCLWLIFKGVDTQQWAKRVSSGRAAAASV